MLDLHFKGKLSKSYGMDRFKWQVDWKLNSLVHFFVIGKMEIQRWIKIIYLLFVWLDATEKIIENYLLKYKILLSH